jgi:hypothetical protein
MSNPNPQFIVVPGPFGAYSSQVSGAVQPSIPAGLVSPGVAGYYQFISNGPANVNSPDANNTAVGK